MEKQIESGLNWNQAETMRKDGKFAEALAVFMAYFTEHHDEPTLWRCIHCARHLKDYRTAVELIESNYQNFTGSEMLRVQFAWLKYDAFMASSRDRGDWEGVLKLADEIFALNPADGEILFRLTLFAAIDAARNLNDHQRVLELTDMVGPQNLAGEGEVYKGRKLVSWRERWYFARLYAMFQVGLYDECRVVAFKAFAEYPRKVEFARKAALCKEKLGCPMVAEEELMAISKVRGCPWYVFADLARLRFENGKYDEALDAACAGARSHGELKTKVNLFALIAKVLLVLGENDQAMNHTVLACSIRNREHWKTPEDLEQLRQRFSLSANLPAPEIIAKKCSEFWKPAAAKTAVEAPDGAEIAVNLPGAIIEIKEGRPFAFINSPAHKGAIFVKIADIPAELQHSGARVVFNLVESFDHKKGCKSVRAMNVRDAEPVAVAA